MPSSILNDETLRGLGDEFRKRLKKGEKPTIEEYTTRFSNDEAKRVKEHLTSIAKSSRKTKACPATASNSAPPKEFGRYSIERTLGEGGMGAVYLAHDSQLDRKVALKTPKFSSNSDPTMMQRFYREARSAATLQHPNICPVYDVGEINGTHYISMAYIEGRPLSDLVSDDKQPPVTSLLKVARKVAIALHEAHSQGLIHRDLKPANIMIDRRNEPIVMDFGLARQFGDEESEPAPSTTIASSPEATSKKIEARITIPGTVMGSPGYMAPEQLQGDQSKIGPASDVYAMGVLLYELLTGQLPFPGTGTLMSVVNAVMSDPPPDATVVRSTLDPRIAAVCRKAMAKSVDDRYESMQTFALAITRLLKSDTDGDRPAGKPVKKMSPELVRTKEQFELARSLYQEGQFAGAVSIMEKMVASDQTPNQHLNQYSKWAQETLPKARAKAEETALLGFTDDGPLGEDLWDAASESASLPPKRKRTKARRKKKAKSFAYTFLAGAAGAIAVLAAAVTIRNAMLSQAAPQTDDESSLVVKQPKPDDQKGPLAEATDVDVDDEDETAQARPGRKKNLGIDRLLQLDQNDDDQLSMKEIKSATRPQNANMRKLLDEFDRIDTNGDKLLDRSELELVFEEFSPNFKGRQGLRRGPKGTKP